MRARDLAHVVQVVAQELVVVFEAAVFFALVALLVEWWKLLSLVLSLEAITHVVVLAVVLLVELLVLRILHL